MEIAKSPDCQIAQSPSHSAFRIHHSEFDMAALRGGHATRPSRGLQPAQRH
jgi:hypothetical protein